MLEISIHILEGVADFGTIPGNTSISVSLTDNDKAFLWENKKLQETRVIGLRMKFGSYGYESIYYGTIGAYTGLNCVGYVTFYLRQWGRILIMTVGWAGSSSIKNVSY